MRGRRRGRSASASPVKRRRVAAEAGQPAPLEATAPGPWRKGFVDGQLREGAYFEGELLSASDLALFRASAVEAHEDSAYVEATPQGALLASTRQALTSAFGAAQPPMVHLCPSAEAACSGPVGGRDAVHVPRWRLRPVRGIAESDYRILPGDLAGSPEELAGLGKSALRERLLALKTRLAGANPTAPAPKVGDGGPPGGARAGPAASKGAGTPGADAKSVSAILAGRGKEFAKADRGDDPRRGRSPDKDRRRRRHRSHSSDSSSRDSGGPRGRRLFRGARTVSERHAARMAERPGEIMASALEEMRKYLVTGQGSTSSQAELTPIVRAYLTSVFLPSAGGAITQRNSEELRTLAEATDRILQGDFAGAGDLLMLRFQAIEMAHADGHWKVARHIMPLSDPRPSASTRSLRAAAAQDEGRATRLSALAAQASRGTSPRPARDGRAG